MLVALARAAFSLQGPRALQVLVELRADMAEAVAQDTMVAEDQVPPQLLARAEAVVPRW